MSPGESRRIPSTRYGSTTLGGFLGCGHPYEAGLAGLDDLEGSEVGSVRELDLVRRDMEKGRVKVEGNLEMPLEPVKAKYV
jgi:hypothetical protein